MKRNCLLSRSYSAPPMTFNGVEIAYSALVNELMRTLKTAVFSPVDDDSMTQHLGMVECIYIMASLATDDKAAIAQHLDQTREQRNAWLVRFYLMHEDEIERLKPEIIARMESAAAASVESEAAGGKPEPTQVP